MDRQRLDQNPRHQEPQHQEEQHQEPQQQHQDQDYAKLPSTHLRRSRIASEKYQRNKQPTPQ